MVQRILQRLHPSSLKLASLYLAIIFTISIFFSAVIYDQSVNELERGLRGPRGGIERSLGQTYSQTMRERIVLERESLYNEAKARVLSKLIITNIIILIAGGALSYYLALRTLRPIEQAQEAQNRFTADASHELRTPITAMLSENEVTLMNDKLTIAEAKAQIKSNIEELQKLTDLSNGLLRIAGLENSKLEKSVINVGEIIQSAIENVQHKAQIQNAKISFSAPKKPIHIYGDEHGIREVFTILLDNALKYSNRNSIVTLKISTKNSIVRIAVSDNGIGIAASDIPILFERFYRADTSRTKQVASGYGLGLAIANDIVKLHGGKITITSKVGVGSTFTVHLPAATK